ncbi:MAG: ABC transporter substrate-binding protein [Byssovorax sp.]
MNTKSARTPRGLRGAGRLAVEVGLAALSTLGIGLAATSCSLIVDTNSAQCTTDADCDAVDALKGRTCDTQKGLCVAPTAPKCTKDADCTSATSDQICNKDGACVDVECSKNQTCANKNGAYSICRKNACIKLTTELCQTVYSTKDNHQDAYLDENAFFVGSILPSDTYDPIGPVIENAAKLALDDFKKQNGLPAATGTGRRPMVLIGCNDGPNGDQGKVAVNHLIDDLGIQAILGYAFSGTTIELATDVTVPKGVLLFSPSATSNDITQIKDEDLLWRTSPRDSFQAAALSGYYAEVEARARKLYPTIPANEMKVAIVHNNDSYGVGLADALEAQLMFNGKSALSQSGAGGHYKRIDYGSPDSPDLGAVTTINSFGPHVIFIFGFNEGVATIFPQVESKWPDQADMHHPLWVFSDAELVSELYDSITTEDMRQRVSGSTPGVLKDKYLPYATFLNTWDSSAYSMGGTVSADTLGPAGAYDIIYMFAYAAVANGQDPITGANLVKNGLRHMEPVEGMNIPKVTVGRMQINDAFAKLQAGSAIDIEGTSGPLDFDKYGEAPSDIQVWCVPKGTGAKVTGTAFNSGRFYSASTGKMDGAFDSKCDLP